MKFSIARDTLDQTVEFGCRGGRETTNVADPVERAIGVRGYDAVANGHRS